MTFSPIVLSLLLIGAVRGSLRRGEFANRVLQGSETACADSDSSPECSVGGPKPQCTPYRSPDYCADAVSFPSLIAKRRDFVFSRTNEFRKLIINSSNGAAPGGWWFPFLDDKLAGHVFARGGGYNPPKIYSCSPDGIDAFTPTQAASETGYVVRATTFHSSKGVYVLPDGFGGIELLRNITMTREDIRTNLIMDRATGSIVIEEFIGGDDGKLPIEFKFHMFGDEIGSINVAYGKGTDCACWAEIDEDRNRLDMYGCFTPMGMEQTNGQCTTIDFTTGSKKPFPVKDLDLCSELPDIEESVWNDMISMAKKAGTEIGVYIRVDFFVGANKQVYLQEFSTNHLNGLRHCSARLDENGCIDSCFLGKMWQKMGQTEGANFTMGGTLSPDLNGLETHLQVGYFVSREYQCMRLVDNDIPVGDTFPPTPEPSSPPTYAGGSCIAGVGPCSVVKDWYKFPGGGDGLSLAVEDASGTARLAIRERGCKYNGLPLPDGRESCGVQIFEVSGDLRDSAQVGTTIVPPPPISEQGSGTFGSKLALNQDGSVLVVGDPGNVDQGTVYVYRFVGTDWDQVGPRLTGVNPRNQLGSAVAISGDGSMIAAGARAGESRSSGEAKVYRLDETNILEPVWNQVGQTISPSGFGSFGSTIAMSQDGKILAIGQGSFGQLNVFVYELMEGSSQGSEQWVPRGAPFSPNDSRDSFGPSSLTLSADGNRVCFGVDALDLATGFAQVFAYDQDQQGWTQLGSTLNGESTSDVEAAISRDGQVVIVGDASTDSNGINNGMVWIYRFQDNDWRLVGEPLVGAMEGSTLGHYLSLSYDGRLIAIGGDIGLNFNQTGSVWVAKVEFPPN